MRHAKLVIAYLLGMSIISLSIVHSQTSDRFMAMSLNTAGPPVLWSPVVPTTTTSTTQPAPTTTEPQPDSPPPTQHPRTTQPPTTDPPPDTTPVETQTTEPAPESGNDVVGIIHEVFGSTGDKATRVANCESTLNPSAVSKGGGNWGLFQINTVHRGDFEDFTGVSWNDGILDARLNSQYALKLYNEQGWAPWSCGRA